MAAAEGSSGAGSRTAPPHPDAEAAAEEGGAGPALVPEEGEGLRGVVDEAHAAGAAAAPPLPVHIGSATSAPAVPWESGISLEAAECLSAFGPQGSETGSELERRVRDIGESLHDMGKSSDEVLMATRIEYAKVGLQDLWQVEAQQDGSTEGIRDWALRKFTEDDYSEYIALGGSPEEVEARVRACGRWVKLPYGFVTRHLDTILREHPSRVASSAGPGSTVSGRRSREAPPPEAPERVLRPRTGDAEGLGGPAALTARLQHRG